MASEEERARIMAEYLADSNANDGEEEEEFQDEEDDDEEFAVQEGQGINCPVLQGRLKLNEENRLLYLGTWCMKHDLGKDGGGSRGSSSSSSKSTTFKLKSIQPMEDSFSLSKPILSGNKENKIFMNGFFHTDATDQVQPHRKIKEKGVELVLTKQQQQKAGSKTFQVMGTGTNEFGGFALKGTYTPNEKEKTYWLQCEKFYGGIPAELSEDEIDSEDEQKDALELGDLQDDAELTVEELQKKYYGASAATAATPPKPKSSSSSSSSRGKADRQERLKKRNGTTTTTEEQETADTTAEDTSKPPAVKKQKTEEKEDDVESKKAASGDGPPALKPAADEDGDDDNDDDDDCGF
ncbi:MAG: hypothetical protein SGBAC_013460 [Bacillariaceae sp.]